MTRALVAAFLVSHGLIHAAIYAAPKPADATAPFDPSHSWILSAAHVAAGTTRATSLAGAWATAALFAVSAAALLAGAGWWTVIAAAAALAGATLKLAFFSPWLTVGVLLDAGVLAAVAAGWPPSIA